MSLVLPLVLGLLGRQVGQGGESGLMNLLGKPRNFLQDLPAGLSGILGMGGATAAAARPAMAEATRHASSAVPESTGARKWLLPLLIVVALAALASYFLSRRGPVPVMPESTAPSTAMPSTATAPAAPTAALPSTSPSAMLGSGMTGLGDMTDKSLPGGASIKIPANGVESKLLAFIEDPSMTVTPDKWFTFDRLDFETGSATLKPASQEQLDNVAAIMKAYPQVSIKIGGYTDNTGAPSANLQLSQARADAAMQQLVEAGVASSRVTTEGFGEQHPVADNATEEGRQRNRRVDMNVTQK
jgi:outer membrane protein OmpA-like peptidoglycan-associated protein